MASSGKNPQRQITRKSKKAPKGKNAPPHVISISDVPEEGTSILAGSKDDALPGQEAPKCLNETSPQCEVRLSDSDQAPDIAPKGHRRWDPNLFKVFNPDLFKKVNGVDLVYVGPDPYRINVYNRCYHCYISGHLMENCLDNPANWAPLHTLPSVLDHTQPEALEALIGMTTGTSTSPDQVATSNQAAHSDHPAPDHKTQEGANQKPSPQRRNTRKAKKAAKGKNACPQLISISDVPEEGTSLLAASKAPKCVNNTSPEREGCRGDNQPKEASQSASPDRTPPDSANSSMVIATKGMAQLLTTLD